MIRVASTEADAALTARAWAISYVDIQLGDGHVERWLGSGSLHDNPTRPLPYDTLLAWGEAVADEHSMIGDLGTAFRDVDRHALESAPIEIVVEWNAELPQTR